MKALIEALVLPPTSLFLIATLGFVLLVIRVRGGAWVCFAAVLVLYALSTPVVGRMIGSTLVSHAALEPSKFTDDVGAIVILGAGRYENAPEYGGDTIRGQALERIRYGALLHRRTGRPILVSGGDPDERGTPEASLMKQTLEGEFGVPVAWIESVSVDTAENAAMSRAILEKAGIRKIYLVTHAQHMPRAMRAFTNVGFDVVAAPTILPAAPAITIDDFVPSGGGLSASSGALHEWLGRAWYQLAP